MFYYISRNYIVSLSYKLCMYKEKIFEKIKELQLKNPVINKFFYFDLNDLKNEPEKCFSLIENFIESNKDKIIDFEIDSWYNEKDFKKVFMIKMELNHEIASHIIQDTSLNNLLPSEMESEIVRERIQNIFLKYERDFKNKEKRKNIIEELYYQFNDKVEIIDLIDKYPEEEILFPFMITLDNKEYTLNEYVELVGNRGRFK